MDYLEAEAKISYSIVNHTSIINVNTFALLNSTIFYEPVLRDCVLRLSQSNFSELSV